MNNSQNEDNILAKTRVVGLDIVATMHMIHAKENNLSWNCICSACEYVRKEPRLVLAIQKAINKK